MTRLALLLVPFLLAGCADPEEGYQQQRARAAAQSPAHLLGFRLHIGASRSQVTQALDSLQRLNALQVRIFTDWDTFRAPLHPVPLFVQDSLVGLRVDLPTGMLTKPLVVGLLDSLRGQYGEDQYRPATDDWYWFSGNTEIDYGYLPQGRWRLSYTYLLPRSQASPKYLPPPAKHAGRGSVCVLRKTTRSQPGDSSR